MTDDRRKLPKTLVVFDPGEPGETDDDDGGLNILVPRGKPSADTLLGPTGVEVAVDDIVVGGGDRGGEADNSYPSPLMAIAGAVAWGGSRRGCGGTEGGVVGDDAAVLN